MAFFDDKKVKCYLAYSSQPTTELGKMSRSGDISDLCNLVEDLNTLCNGRTELSMHFTSAPPTERKTKNKRKERGYES